MNWVVARVPVAWPLFRGPMRSFFDRRASGWDERTGAGSAEHLAPLAAALLQVQPAPERALDLGTGTGVGALLIAREFPHARVRGVDISEEMIRLARARIGLDPEGRVAFRVADASSLPYEEDSFDLVAQLNMPPFFGEMARVLRPGRPRDRRLELGSRHPVLHAADGARARVSPPRPRAGGERRSRPGHVHDRARPGRIADFDR